MTAAQSELRLPTFFSAIQGYFSAEFAGRYIALIMAETCRADSTPFRRFFHQQFGNKKFRSGLLSLEPEFSFDGLRGRRRADLAVRLDGEIVALIELKYRDKLMVAQSGTRPAQLDDYLMHCRKEGLKLLLLSRDPPTDEEIEKISRHRQSRSHYAVLAMCLARSPKLASQMLFEYFREEGLVVETLNEDYLYRFLHRFLKPWGQAGRINSMDALAEGPAQLQALLNNMRLIAADLAPRLKPRAANGRSRGATVDFEIQGWFAGSELRSVLAGNEKKGEFEVPAKARRGGYLWVYAQHALVGGSDWIYVDYGVGFELNPGSRSTAPFLYGEVTAKHLGTKPVLFDKAIRFGLLENPENKPKVEQELLQLLRKAAKKAISTGAITGAGKAALARI